MPSHMNGLPPSGVEARQAKSDMSMVGRRLSNGENPSGSDVNLLKQELIHSRAETKKVTDQVNCLVSLIRRAWSGDMSATHHLSNIVGLPPPDFLDGTKGRPASRAESRANNRVILRWERLTVRLLERDYQQLQMEIAAQQQAYLASRQMYMEEVLRAHQQDMGSKVSSKMEEVDKRFVRHYGGHSRRTGSARKLYRTSSVEGRRARPPSAKDMVENADFTLRDLVAIGNPPPAGNVGGAFPRRHSDLGRSLKKKALGPDYDDPVRYAPPSNLFDVDAVFSADAFNKKARPISAAVMQEHDSLRARPRSAVFVTQRGERPMKYETTRPLEPKKAGSSNSKGGRVRMREPESPGIYPPPDPQSWGDEEADAASEEEGMEPQPDLIKAPLRIRVSSALNRPKSVGQLTDDLQRMGDMEEEFRKTTLSLQKKLGLDENGII